MPSPIDTTYASQQFPPNYRGVVTYLERIYRNMGAHNRTEAVTAAQREQLLASD